MASVRANDASAASFQAIQQSWRSIIGEQRLGVKTGENKESDYPRIPMRYRSESALSLDDPGAEVAGPNKRPLLFTSNRFWPEARDQPQGKTAFTGEQCALSALLPWA